MSRIVQLAKVSRIPGQPYLVRSFGSSVCHSAGATKDWEGRDPKEHVARQDHRIDIHASASVEGRKERSTGSRGESASTEKDHKDGNQKAKEDHPEAPGPVIGMNDERGGVSTLEVIPTLFPSLKVSQKGHDGKSVGS